MTGRPQEQTGALMAANELLDTRRAFMEAVLSSVTAGVIALDPDGNILLTNRTADALLAHGEEGIEGRQLGDVSSELGEFMAGETKRGQRAGPFGRGAANPAVKRMRYGDGFVLTFDDITDQLSDQRRAAWSDIARRIAHEIKNPLTPIQLAAERLSGATGPKSHPTRNVRAPDRHDHPAGRRPPPNGRRILQLRAHAQAGVPRGECP